MPPTDRPGPATLVTATCWSCDRTIAKRVASRNRGHQHLMWACDHCEVQWIGPGTRCEQRAAW